MEKSFVLCSGKLTTLGGVDKGAAAAILEIAKDLLGDRGSSQRALYPIYRLEGTGVTEAENMDRRLLKCKYMVVADAAGPGGIHHEG